MLRTAILLGVAALIGPVSAGAQGLAELARETEEKREESKEASPTYTGSDLRRGGTLSTGVDSVPASRTSAGADQPEGEGGDGEGQGDGGEEPEKTRAELRAEAQTAWREKLTAAEAEVTRLQAEVSQLEQALAATTGMYNEQREGRAQRLEQARGELSAAQQSVSALRTEGRRNGYR